MGAEFQDFERKMTFWAVEVFNPKTGDWTTLPHMLVARHGLAAAFLGPQLHVMGGGFQSDGMFGVDPTTATHEVIDLGHEINFQSVGSRCTIEAPWLLPTQNETGAARSSTKDRRILVCLGNNIQ